MKDEISPRSGILDCEQGSATFYEDNFDFRIMNSVPFKATSSSTEDFAKIAQEDKYFHGTTHDGNDIAIYCGNRIMPTIRTIANFHSNIYAIQKGNLGPCNWNKIDAIEFRSGTLDALSFSPDSPYEFVGRAIQVIPPQLPLSFSFKYEGLYITVKSGNQSNETYNSTHVELIGRTRYLTLQFSEPISFGEVPVHIEKIKTLLSFMTFRQNVDFNEIALQEKTAPSDVLMDTALVYSKGPLIATQKKPLNNICFNDLDVTISSLIELIYCEQKNNPFSFMNFIPANDSNFYSLTDDMVKGIVTCLDCEIARLRGNDVELIEPDSKSEIYLAEEKELSALKKELHSTIKGFQKKHHRFSKKTSDMLKGTIDHMTLAEAEKFFLLYSNYQNLICKLFCHFDIKPTKEDIERLIIYRNRTTHGEQEVLGEHIMATSIHLIGLIYCLILHSIGIDDRQLEQLCSRHFLLL